MGKKIKGVHHIAIKPTPEDYEKTVGFYTGLLGFEVKQRWGDPKRPCLMVSCGDNTCMEILPQKPGFTCLQTGPLCHIAFATDQVDTILEEARAAGYEILVEPKETELNSRIAFFRGPVGEEIELFWEKD